MKKAISEHQKTNAERIARIKAYLDSCSEVVDIIQARQDIKKPQSCGCGLVYGVKPIKPR